MILTFALESGRKATVFKDKTMIEAAIMAARFLFSRQFWDKTLKNTIIYDHR